MKAYTNIEQSKVLSKILPLESADMYWFRDNVEVPRMYPKDMMKDSVSVTCPCWSLAALLDILAEQYFIIKSVKYNNEYQFNIDIPIRHCKIWFPSLLDAAFEMVLWLKKNGEI